MPAMTITEPMIHDMQRMRDADVAAKYGCDRDTIRRARRKHGIKRYGLLAIDKERPQAWYRVLKDLVAAGEVGIAQADLNTRYGVTRESIRQALERLTDHDLVISEEYDNPKKARGGGQPPFLRWFAVMPVAADALANLEAGELLRAEN